MALYSNARVDIDGKLLLQCSSVEVTGNSNAQDQETLALGWAGKSPGAPKLMIRSDHAVPSVGSFEFDPGPPLNALTEVSITVYTDTSFLTTKGFINTYQFRKATNNPASLSFEAECKFSQWQAL